jgi:hypothetical protein
MATPVDCVQKMEANEADSETGVAPRPESGQVAVLRKELEALDQMEIPIAYKLLKAQLDAQLRKEEGKRPSLQENPEYIRVDDKTVKLTHKLIVPVEKDPEFKFVGKILGTKGANMKQISMETNVKLSIRGKGSSKEKNPEKEKELAESGKPEFEHLKEPLHVRVDSIGHPSKVWISMQRALDMLGPLVVPDQLPFTNERRQRGEMEEENRFLYSLFEELYRDEQRMSPIMNMVPMR